MPAVIVDLVVEKVVMGVSDLVLRVVRMMLDLVLLVMLSTETNFSHENHE